MHASYNIGVYTALIYAHLGTTWMEPDIKKPNVLLYQLDYQLQISHEDPAEKEGGRDMTGSQCRYSVSIPGLRIQKSTSSLHA